MTERDVVLREREAYKLGVNRMFIAPVVPVSEEATRACERCEDEAVWRYPLPKITRPRVVSDPHNHEPQWGRPREWACMGGVIVSRTIGVCVRKGNAPFKWTQTAQVPPTRQRCKLWADLLENPNETVEDV